MQQKTIRGPVRLEQIHSSGRSVAISDGKKVYIDFGIPGEEVTYALERRKQGFRSGKVVEVIAPSPNRIEPFCAHYGECGGCTWQHIDYQHQLTLKRNILCNALEKYEIETPEIPAVIPSTETHYFRHRLEYTFSARSFGENSPEGRHDTSPALGFHSFDEPGKVIDIRECYLQQQPSRSICEFIKAYALEHHLDFYNQQHKTGFLRSLSIRVNRSGDTMVVVGFHEDRQVEREKLLRTLMHEFPAIVSACWTVHKSHLHSQMQGEIIPFAESEPYLYKIMGGNRFRVHASSFFQPNAKQAEKIFHTIQQWAELTGSEKVYDLYTGVGTIALFLVPGAKQVTGIEGSAGAIDDARANARMNGIENAEFMVGDILETFKPEFLDQHGKPDLIVLDPPRSGTLIEIKKTINLSGAKKVIYLSCNPVSLAFDLKQLTEVYRVTRIQPFDMLPHTQHLETLVMLEIC
ncbi:MAG: 23S rRNA (uracil(1939)-C(5))-methyltransferase RlmD [Bacteroidales bacterium]